MARITVLPNGVTASCPRYGPLAAEPPKRGRIGGWSTQATRRLRRWFYSVDGAALSLYGDGYAFTLTVRDLPPSSGDWTRTRRSFVERMGRRGMVACQWLTEWQRRGVPHLHGIVYFDPGVVVKRRGRVVPAAEVVTSSWMRAAVKWGPGERSQHVQAVWGLPGWLQYQAKHSVRGVGHYQRANLPEAWQGASGRLWGTLGAWPVREQLAEVDMRTFHRFRRLMRRWLVAEARGRGDYRRLAWLRRMLADPEPLRSAVRAVGEFCPEELSRELLLAAAEGDLEVADQLVGGVVPIGAEDGSVEVNGHQAEVSWK